ncbi:aminopeptidase LapA [Legionella impletisoli]|uniref:Aminopeptidase n=1 Tax=Legionella impletisoli TaxID=343510 RepID=A0A917NAU1_9GAMM|nr:M20/M25/M40 family metallo-hydrolase [Legionella impletisoli]GGI84477.1 aminopeptidase [Legionella impletisoli]
MRQTFTLYLLAGWLITTAAIAMPEPTTQQLQVPSCLAKTLTMPYKVIAETHAFKIIEVPFNQLDDIRIAADKARCGRFVNVTKKLEAQSKEERLLKAKLLLLKPKPKAALKEPIRYSLQHHSEVQNALALVEDKRIEDTLIHLTSYTNRSAVLNNGVQTAQWLKQSFDQMAIEYGRKDVDSYFVTTGGWFIQPSVVTVIGHDLSKPGIVIGAHMDTLGKTERQRMPGAGDDGSGSASIMEVARVLLSSKLALKRPIYIIWYAAEEQGLVGSQAVVQAFKDQNIPVFAAIQFDMTGFRNDPNDKTMWVFKDYTDPSLSDFVSELITTYINVPVKYSRCGYGCSDHASWNVEGVPAAFPCETSFEAHNPYIHSALDTMDLLSTDHMSNFTKLGLAFAIELGAR